MNYNTRVNDLAKELAIFSFERGSYPDIHVPWEQLSSERKERRIKNQIPQAKSIIAQIENDVINIMFSFVAGKTTTVFSYTDIQNYLKEQGLIP